MKMFKKPAPTQRMILRTLRNSPMPWTYEMIAAWARHKSRSALVNNLVQSGRIVRIARGVYMVGK